MFERSGAFRLVASLLTMLFGLVSLTQAAGPVHPESEAVTTAVAQKVADVFLGRLSQGVYPDWAGAQAVAPRFYRQLNNSPSAWVYTVRKGGSSLGYISVAATKDQRPFIEASPSTPPHERLVAARSALLRDLTPGQTLGSPKLLYVNFLAYLAAFPVMEGGRITDMAYYHLKGNFPLKASDKRFPAPYTPGNPEGVANAWDKVLNHKPSVGDVSIMATVTKKLSVPSYNQSNSSDPNTDCGPTAGAMIADYWDDVMGKTNIKGLEFYGTEGSFIDHMANDMDTGFYGTTKSEWKAGMEAHLNTEAGYSFTVTIDTSQTWSEYHNEIYYSDRPVGIYIPCCLPWGSTGNGDYEYHWVTGKGYEYDTNLGYQFMIINNSWGQEDTIDFDRYNDVDGLDYVYVRG